MRALSGLLPRNVCQDTPRPRAHRAAHPAAARRQSAGRDEERSAVSKSKAPLSSDAQ